MKAMGYPHQHTRLGQTRCEFDLNFEQIIQEIYI